MQLRPRKKLKKLRKKRGYTQEEIANKLKIPRSTYAGYEQGYSTPSLYTAFKIKQLLMYSEDDIFF